MKHYRKKKIYLFDFWNAVGDSQGKAAMPRKKGSERGEACW